LLEEKQGTSKKEDKKEYINKQVYYKGDLLKETIVRSPGKDEETWKIQASVCMTCGLILFPTCSLHVL
jgi:hypothetical protein